VKFILYVCNVRFCLCLCLMDDRLTGCPLVNLFFSLTEKFTLERWMMDNERVLPPFRLRGSAQVQLNINSRQILIFACSHCPFSFLFFLLVSFLCFLPTHTLTQRIVHSSSLHFFSLTFTLTLLSYVYNLAISHFSTSPLFLHPIIPLV
jgi:hypothetical protein